MAGSRPQIVWPIGGDSLDPHQFSDHQLAVSTTRAPEFRIGMGDPGPGWSRVQPGPLNAPTGFGPVAEPSIQHPHGADGTAWLTTAAERPLAEAYIDESGQVRLSRGRHRVRALLLPPGNAGRPGRVEG